MSRLGICDLGDAIHGSFCRKLDGDSSVIHSTAAAQRRKQTYLGSSVLLRAEELSTAAPDVPRARAHVSYPGLQARSKTWPVERITRRVPQSTLSTEYEQGKRVCGGRIALKVVTEGKAELHPTAGPRHRAQTHDLYYME